MPNKCTDTISRADSIEVFAPKGYISGMRNHSENASFLNQKYAKELGISILERLNQKKPRDMKKTEEDKVISRVKRIK